MTSEQTLQKQLARLLAAIEASGRATLPRSELELLQSIVEAAARIFGAAAASIALVDEARQVLEFRVATGAGKEQVMGMRIPLNQGLAGYVIMTGQPIAVHNVREDKRFREDFAKSTGYVPQSILAMPLFSDDRVIGVMEVLDKIAAPAFGMQDMELLGLFARQAAIAIHQSQEYGRLSSALAAGLRRLVPPEDRALSEALASAESVPPDTGLLAVADMFYALSQLGEYEQRACLDILTAFQQYARSKAALNFF